MSARFKNLVGQRFGLLTAISKSRVNKFGSMLWLCRCDCGGNTVASSAYLVSGRSKSCGCVPRRRPIEDRFWEFVIKGPRCWEWSGYLNRKGYGTIWNPDKQGPMFVHVFSYKYHIGEIPRGLFVLHSCDNPKCVNPKHLFLGTLADNNKDMKEKGRASRGGNHHYAKLTEKGAQEILNRLIGGESRERLANEFGVSSQTVYLIGRGRAWFHLRYSKTRNVSAGGSTIKGTIVVAPNNYIPVKSLGVIVSQELDLLVQRAKSAC